MALENLWAWRDLSGVLSSPGVAVSNVWNLIDDGKKLSVSPGRYMVWMKRTQAHRGVTLRAAADHSHVGMWVQRRPQPQGHWLPRSGPESKCDDLQSRAHSTQEPWAAWDAGSHCRHKILTLITLIHLPGMSDLSTCVGHWALTPPTPPQQPQPAGYPSSCCLSDVLLSALGIAFESGAWQLGSLTGKKGKISIWLKLALPSLTYK